MSTKRKPCVFSGVAPVVPISTPSLLGCGETLTGSDLRVEAEDSNAPEGRRYRIFVNNRLAADGFFTPIYLGTVPRNGATITKQIDYSDDGGESYNFGDSCNCTAAVLSVEPECFPDCTRWTSVNEGEPIKIFHDTSRWDPEFYDLIGVASPNQFLERSIAIWNEGYSCGVLFEIVTERAEATVVVQYAYGEEIYPDDPCFALGNAECFCDSESEICVEQVDHSAFFTTDRPAIVNIIFNECISAFWTANAFTNTYVHELGHILGMGHVYEQPFDSVMGNRPNRDSEVLIFDFDREQSALRYPCGCDIATPQVPFFEPSELPHYSSRGCPGCRLIL